MVNENNIGYWQRNNFLITRNEIVLFPNAKWDNKVIEVMTITDEINILISSIHITKLEWIIEVKNTEGTVYTQSNYYSHIYKLKKEGEMDEDSNQKNEHAYHDELKPISPKDKLDDKTRESKFQHRRNTSTSSLNYDPIASRECKWILKFDNRESMLYFISLIKYIQTKKSKRLLGDEEMPSMESSDFSISSNEDGVAAGEGKAKNASKLQQETQIPLQSPLSPFSETNPIEKDMTSPKSNYLSPTSTSHTIVDNSFHRERTSSLSEHNHSNEQTTSPSMLNSSVEVKNTNLWSRHKEKKSRGKSLERKDSLSHRTKPEKKLHVVKGMVGGVEGEGEDDNHRNLEESNKNSERKSSSKLKDSIRKAEIELMRLQDWHKNNKSRNSSAPNLSESYITREKEEKGHPSSPQEDIVRTSWQNARERIIKRSSFSPNSSASFTNIHLSYLDVLEDKTKNKIIKLNNGNSGNNDNTLPTEMDPIPIIITESDSPPAATEPSTTKGLIIEEDNFKPEKTKKKVQGSAKAKHRLSSSVSQTGFDTETLNSNISPNTDSILITNPMSSPSTTSIKYSSSLPSDIKISDTTKAILKDSATAIRKNSKSKNEAKHHQKSNNNSSLYTSKRVSSLVNLEKLNKANNTNTSAGKKPSNKIKSLIIEEENVDTNSNVEDTNNISLQPNSIENDEPKTEMNNTTKSPEVGPTPNNVEVNQSILSIKDTPALTHTKNQSTTTVGNEIKPLKSSLVNGKPCPRRTSSLFHSNNSTGNNTSAMSPRNKVISGLYRTSSNGKYINENARSKTENGNNSVQSSRQNSITNLNNLSSSRQNSSVNINSMQSPRQNNSNIIVNIDNTNVGTGNANIQPSRQNSTSTSDNSSTKHSRHSSGNKLEIPEALHKSLTRSNMRPFSIATDSPLNEMNNDTFNRNKTNNDNEDPMNRYSSGSDTIKYPNISYSVGMEPFIHQLPQLSVSPNNHHVHANGYVSQPQSPTTSRPHSLFINSTVNNKVFKPINEELPKLPIELILTYKDVHGQSIQIPLDDESIIPNSFLRPLKKSTSPVTFDPIILNSLEILSILEQTYL